MSLRLNGRYIQICFIRIWQWLGQGCTNFQKSRSHLNFLGARRITWSEFQTEDQKILGATLQNFVARVTLHPVFVHPWTRLWAAQSQFVCQVGQEFFSLWLCLVQLWRLPSHSSPETKALSWPFTSTWCWDMSAWS
jgi:hypothetical protein